MMKPSPLRPRKCSSSGAKDHRVAKASCSSNRLLTKVKRSRKSVRFFGTVKIGLKRVTSEELNNTWYNPSDYKGFKKEGKRSLRAVQLNLSGDAKAYDPSQHCLRGLEACMSTDLYRQRQERKSNVIQTVLNHQLLNRLLGVKNAPERLAIVSKELSRETTERALSLAAFDSKCNPAA